MRRQVIGSPTWTSAASPSCSQGRRGVRRGLPGDARGGGISPDDVDLIGSHGQTVYHHSGVAGAIRATLQLGDGDVIAVRTGVSVISDFRARDIAAGGEGAPLSPIADTVLFGRRGGEEPGRAGRSSTWAGSPTSPCSTTTRRGFSGSTRARPTRPLDRLARRLSGGALACDRDGRFARSGRVNEPLLAELLDARPFLARRPPKSTGFEMYGDAFVARAAERHGGYDADLMATLTEFIARTVAWGIRQCDALGPPVEEIVAAGGGVKNPVLMERIAALVAPVPVRRSDELGVPSDAREAMAFAVLADMTLRGRRPLSRRSPEPPRQAARQALVPLESLSVDTLAARLAPAASHEIPPETGAAMNPIDLAVIAVYVAGCTALGAWLGSRSQG